MESDLGRGGAEAESWMLVYLLSLSRGWFTLVSRGGKATRKTTGPSLEGARAGGWWQWWQALGEGGNCWQRVASFGRGCRCRRVAQGCLVCIVFVIFFEQKVRKGATGLNRGWTRILAKRTSESGQTS